MVVVSKTGRSDKPVLSPTAQAVRHMCMNLRNVWSFLQPSINHTLVFREELFYSILRDIADPRWIELFKLLATWGTAATTFYLFVFKQKKNKKKLIHLLILNLLFM